MIMHTSEGKCNSSLSSKLLAMQNDDVCKTIKYSQEFSQPLEHGLCQILLFEEFQGSCT